MDAIKFIKEITMIGQSDAPFDHKAELNKLILEAQKFLNSHANDEKILLKEFDQYKRESIKWSIEDFTEYEGYYITPEKAKEALEHMIRKHDAEIGITWETVRCYLEIYGARMGKFLVKDYSGRGAQVILDTKELIEKWGDEFVEDGDEGLTFSEWAMDADIGDKEEVEGQATSIERIE